MKALFSLLCCAFFGVAQAQLEFVHDFSVPPEYYTSWALIDNDMPKMIARANGDIQVYNLDFSLYAQITVPDEYADTPNYLYITRSLFDCDTTQLEYMVAYSHINPAESYIRVLREDGTELFALDGYSLNSSYIDSDLTTVDMVSDSAGTYFGFITEALSNDIKVYRACGQLPQMSPRNSDGSIVSGLQAGDAPAGRMRMFPNPGTDHIKVEYDLRGQPRGVLTVFDLSGRQVLEKKLGPVFNHLVIDVSNFKAGTYVARISGENGSILTEKFIKVGN